MDIIENFIMFDDSSGRAIKIVGRNHQFMGVNPAVDSVRNREQRQGKLGAFWHTQGSRKSYSMVFFTGKVHRKIGGSFTFVMLTDRDDLDTQLYKTFAGCGVVDHDKDPCRADSTGLSVDSYDEDDISHKTNAVFEHVYRAYPTVPSPVYA